MNIFELVGEIAIKGIDNAEKQLGSLEGYVKKNEKAFKALGTMMTGVGAAITGSLAMMTKAAQDESINVAHLSQTLKNVGVEYDNVKDSLEAVILATQKKTGVADDAQRDILSRLVLVTNDYDKALSLLPTVLDLAAAGQMDATTAATYLGKAYLELEGGAEDVSVRFGQASLKFKSMADIQDRVAGSAEAMADPLNIMKAGIGDVAEDIGANLLPLLSQFKDRLLPIIDGIQQWMSKNPGLTKTIVLAAAALGGLMLAIGPMLIALPMLPGMIAGFKFALHLLQIAFHTTGAAATSMWGAITLGASLAITAGILVWQNWDKVVDFFKGAWINIKLFFLNGVKSVLDNLAMFTKFIPGLSNLVDSARGKMAGMIDSVEIEKDALAAERALRDVEEAIADTTEITNWHADATEFDSEALTANTAALEEQEAQLQEQITAYEELAAQVAKTRREYEYERSEAGKLGISTKDVTFALFDMGWTSERVTHLMESLGDEADNVNSMLIAVGMTAADVKGILDKHSETVDALADSYDGMADAAARAAEKIASLDAMRATARDTSITGEAHGEAVRAYNEQLVNDANALVASGAAQDIYHALNDLGATVPAYRLQGYATGGLITEPTLLTHVGDARPFGIMAEKGPEPIGWGRGVTVTGNNFYVREEADIDKIGQALEKQIRLRQGIRG